MIYINGSILDEKPSGLGVYTKNIVKNLFSENTDMYVFSPVDIEGAKVKKITKYVKPKYKKLGGLIRFLWTQMVLPFKVRKNDIIYHPFQYISLFSRAKQIITIHDLIPIYFPKVAPHQYIYYKIIMPILLKRASKVVVISENTKKDVEKFYNIDEKKIEVIYNGYTLVENKSTNDKDILKDIGIYRKYFLMIGVTYQHKNIHRVIEAYKKLGRFEENSLVIVGRDTKYVEYLKTLVEKYNLNEQIVFLNYVSDVQLSALYSNCVAFVYPSLYEGFGLPILEAMSSGTIVLSSNTSSMPEIAGDAGILFDPYNIDEIKDKLELVLDRDDIKDEYISKGYENIKRFNWSITARKVYRVIKELN